MTATDHRDRTGRDVVPQPWVGGLWGSAVALVGNSVIFFVANALLAGVIETAQGGQPPADLPYAAVAAASVIPVFIGAAVLWGLGRFSSLGLRGWSVLAAAVTLLSLLAPALMEVDTGSKVALGLMHLATGSAAVWGQRRAADRR